jgi:hypothetical protein
MTSVFRLVIGGLVLAGAATAAAQAFSQAAPAARSDPAKMVEIPQKVIDFLAFCQDNDETCASYMGAIGDALTEGAAGYKKTDYCAPTGAQAAVLPERVLKWMMLRPQTHSRPTNRTVAEALIAIYPCRQPQPASNKKSDAAGGGKAKAVSEKKDAKAADEKAKVSAEKKSEPAADKNGK